jgi:hypothetical protein
MREEECHHVMGRREMSRATSQVMRTLLTTPTGIARLGVAATRMEGEVAGRADLTVTCVEGVDPAVRMPDPVVTNDMERRLEPEVGGQRRRSKGEGCVRGCR